MPDHASAYAPIIAANLKCLESEEHQHLARRVGGEIAGAGVVFGAFGGICRIDGGGITLDGARQQGPLGVILSLYALHASAGPCVLLPLRAFRELPGSMPYVAAFASHSERPLQPVVEPLVAAWPEVAARMGGREARDLTGGDAAFIVYPVPKIALTYVLYRPDDELPASVTCLFSCNAADFAPVDALADIAEHTTLALRRWTAVR
jgi:hypothetical protein